MCYGPHPKFEYIAHIPRKPFYVVFIFEKNHYNNNLYSTIVTLTVITASMIKVHYF